MGSKKKVPPSTSTYAACGKAVVINRGGKRGAISIPRSCGKPQGHGGRCK